MKARRLAVCYAIFALLLLLVPVYRATCQTYVAYSVQINSDGSALWKITNFSDINADVDTFSGFQSKVSNVISLASIVTQRTMEVDENSLQINTTISSQSKTTEYSFLWQNFSIIQGKQLIFGDVFKVNDFFNLLYGDDALSITYPSTLTVKSVNPAPYQRDDSTKTLDWARTQDLVNGKTEVVLTSTPVNGSSNQNGQLYIIIVGVVAVGAALSGLAFFMLKKRKPITATAATPSESTELVTEEDKILKLLKSSGGSMRQSDIVEQSRFSKAKTSQLLAVLEKNGVITRYKKGRDKIVNLTERVKSD